MHIEHIGQFVIHSTIPIARHHRIHDYITSQGWQQLKWVFIKCQIQVIVTLHSRTRMTN